MKLITEFLIGFQLEIIYINEDCKIKIIEIYKSYFVIINKNGELQTIPIIEKISHVKTT